MTLTLASDANGVLEIMSRIFSRADTLAHPDALLDQLERLWMVWAALFVVAGLACLFVGHKYYKGVTITMSLLVGTKLGYMIGEHVGAKEIIAVTMGVLLAVCSWLMIKYAVAVMTALVGAFVGANIWTAVVATMYTHGAGARPENAHETYWIGALMGLIFFGMLTFILFKVSTIFFTAVCGATLTLLGALSLAMQISSWQDWLRSQSTHNAVVLPLLAIVPTFCVLMLQHTTPQKGEDGGGKSAKGSPKTA